MARGSVLRVLGVKGLSLQLKFDLTNLAQSLTDQFNSQSSL